MTTAFLPILCPECERGRVRVACCIAHDTGHACHCPPRRRGYIETECAECEGTALLWECPVCHGPAIERLADGEMRCGDCGFPDGAGDEADAAEAAMEDR